MCRRTFSDDCIQACVQQESSRDAALELVGDLDSFLQLYGDGSLVQDRKRPQEAYTRMFLLVARIATYVHERTKSGMTGTSCSE